MEHANELADISWAMLGVSRGQNLWSRFAGLIRTQNSYNLQQIREWKCNRKTLPVVQFSERMTRPRKLAEFNSEYFLGESNARRFFKQGKGKSSSKHGDGFNLIKGKASRKLANLEEPKNEPQILDDLLARWEDDHEVLLKRARNIKKSVAIGFSMRESKFVAVGVGDLRDSLSVIDHASQLTSITDPTRKSLHHKLVTAINRTLEVAKRERDSDVEDESEDPEVHDAIES